MRIGWNDGGRHTRLEAIVAEAARARADGFASYWLSQITGPDAPADTERTRALLAGLARSGELS